MANPSNLYAEKIFSEHPVAMWSFDDNVKYLSLVPESVNDLSTGWTFAGGPTVTSFDETTAPYSKLGTAVTSVSLLSVGASGTFFTTSDTTFSSSEDTFTIGFYYFKTTPYLSSFRIGYDIGGTKTWSSSISTSDFYSWQFVSATFNTQVSGAKVAIEFNYSAPVGTDYVTFLLNGLTVGSFAEDSNLVDLGSQAETLPANLAISPSFTKGIPVSRYNSASDLGYVITKDGKSYGRNTSFPMTYGSENVLVLYPNETDSPYPAPSLIVPSHGFLNESEKYKTRTFEAWIRIKAQTLEPRRIIGPITGTDGLYVDGGYLTLSVGKTFGSFYVGEWDRPMLIQIVTSINSSKLFLNGEPVISLTYDTDELSLADYYETSPATYDWIGFYCYVDVPRIEVDSVAIYAYEVDKILALRRFVYAQGIDFPTAMVTSNGGEVVIPDYSVSNYTNNYSYGDSQKLPFSNADVSDNVNILGQRLQPPKYKLPEIRIEPGSTETSQTMLAAQVGSDYLDLQPTAGWNDIESHIYFDKLSQTQDQTKAFYVVATRSEANTSKQIVFKILNKFNGNYLEAYTITSGGNNNIVYSFSYNGTTSTLATVSGNVIGTNFDAGVNIDELISANTTLGSKIQDFFSNQDSLAVYVGGDELFTENTTFTGKIYYVGFTNARNLTKIADLSTNGLFRDNTSIMGSHIATYTLIVKKFAGNVLLDIATNMYWQESVPLASLGKFIGGQNLLDYLQVNLDYPKPIFFSSGEYSTSSIPIRLYLTFQNSTATPLDILDFSTVVTVSDTNVIEDTSAYATTAYEMVDGTVIYVPGVSIDSYVAIIHAEVNVNGIITNPFSLRNIQIASQTLSLDSASPTEIGTKMGPSLIGYGSTASGNNPIILPKENDNHLYLSSNSGMMIAGTPSASRGHYINLNAGESDAFDIGIIQATMKFPMEAFSTSDVLLFEVVKEDATAVKFYIDSINSANNRARVFAKNAGGSPYTAVEYFINGIKTEYPVVSLDEWVTLGIRFTEHFNIASQTAKIKICGPMLLNNLFYSQLKAGDEASKILTTDIWANVLYNGNTAKTWGGYTATITDFNESTPSVGSVTYTANNTFSVGQNVTVSGISTAEYNGTFEVTAATSTTFTVLNSTTSSSSGRTGSAGIWSDAYTATASATEINGLEIQDVYESFVGTQKIIAFYDATSTKLKTKSYQYVAYIGSQSDTITSTPL